MKDEKVIDTTMAMLWLHKSRREAVVIHQRSQSRVADDAYTIIRRLDRAINWVKTLDGHKSSTKTIQEIMDTFVKLLTSPHPPIVNTPKQIADFNTFALNVLKLEWLTLRDVVMQPLENNMLVEAFIKHGMWVREIRYYNNCCDVIINGTESEFNTTPIGRHIAIQWSEDISVEQLDGSKCYFTDGVLPYSEVESGVSLTFEGSTLSEFMEYLTSTGEYYGTKRVSVI